MNIKILERNINIIFVEIFKMRNGTTIQVHIRRCLGWRTLKTQNFVKRAQRQGRLCPSLKVRSLASCRRRRCCYCCSRGSQNLAESTQLEKYIAMLFPTRRTKSNTCVCLQWPERVSVLPRVGLTTRGLPPATVSGESFTTSSSGCMQGSNNSLFNVSF